MKSFLSGRPAHDQPAPIHDDAASAAGRVRLHPAHSIAANHTGAATGPSVECVREGDKVVRLIVTCTCGERVEIDCLYPSSG